MRSSEIQPKKRGANIKRLNPQQRLFVEYLLADKAFNATNAAKKAGYKNANVSGSTLLRNSIVSAAIGKALHERIEKTKVTQERVIYELAAIAFSNIQEVLDDKDQVKKLSTLPDNIARSISSIKVQHKTAFGEDGPEDITIKEIKFWNKTEALTLLAKHLGMITEKHQISGEVKHTIDYEKLYSVASKKVIEVDPVEYQILNPTSDSIPEQPKINYTLEELVEEQLE